MNYLAHAYFSHNNSRKLTGNMIGDFVKGKSILDSLDEDIRSGVLFHREIDQFADENINSLKAKNYFRNDYGLFSGAIVDVMYDYFFANDPHYFANETQLKEFAANTYAKLWENIAFFPDRFEYMLTHMEKEDWLYKIRTMKGMRDALLRLEKRTNGQIEIQKAYETIVKHYYELNQIYIDYIQDFDKFAKSKLI